MLIVKNKSMQEIGILDNAFDVSVERVVNEVWQLSFSLPTHDEKIYLCSHMNYIDAYGSSGRYYGLYRIMPTETKKSESGDITTFQCEHVMATLLDDVIDGFIQVSDGSTSACISKVLLFQTVTRWMVGTVQFNLPYEYSFENENGLLAPVLSIPKAFNLPYEFTYDTSIYPWRLNLMQVSDDIKSEIRWGKDMGEFSRVSDPTEIVNWIIPKGVGEGTNQLSIAKVNDNFNYLKDDISISTWGKRSYIWIDKSIEDAATLKARGQSLLDQLKNPKISFSVKASDLSILPEYSHERRLLNTVTRIIVGDDVYLARIIGEKIPDLTREWEVDYIISNKPLDLTQSNADIERKISVSSAYSQGATNIYTISYQDNCDNTHPSAIRFYIDDDVVNVNTCELTFLTTKYRAYEAGTGIEEAPSLPSNISLLVDGRNVSLSGISGDRLEILSYLDKDAGGRVTRGQHIISMTPNTLGRIEAYVTLRVFIQSRLGGTY